MPSAVKKIKNERTFLLFGSKSEYSELNVK